MLTCELTGRTLSISGDLQVFHLQALKEGLEPALTMNMPLTVDVSGVSGVDLAGLQMLLTFLQSRQAAAPTRLSGAQPALVKALRLTGLDALISPYSD